MLFSAVKACASPLNGLPYPPSLARSIAVRSPWPRSPHHAEPLPLIGVQAGATGLVPGTVAVTTLPGSTCHTPFTPKVRCCWRELRT
jgi:hypothetical protein